MRSRLDTQHPFLSDQDSRMQGQNSCELHQGCVPSTLRPCQGTVNLDHHGIRWDVFLVQMTGYSRTYVQKSIKQSQAYLNNMPHTQAKTLVTAGQQWCIKGSPDAPWDMTAPQPVPMSLTFLYQDEYIAVVDKPAGLVVHPGAGTHDTPTLVQGLMAASDHWSSTAGPHKPGIVHRLDKDTSGVMVVARTQQAHQILSDQFARRTTEKRYWACVWGRPQPAFGMLDTPMARDHRHRTKYAVVSKLTPKARQAVTYYHTLGVQQQGLFSLLECRILTGRTHQIRVHCAYLGHPIVGDTLYTSAGNLAYRVPVGIERQALHARLLAFDHPMSGKRMIFTSPLPSDMTLLCQKLHMCTPNVWAKTSTPTIEIDAG